MSTIAERLTSRTYTVKFYWAPPLLARLQSFSLSNAAAWKHLATPSESLIFVRPFFSPRVGGKGNLFFPFIIIALDFTRVIKIPLFEDSGKPQAFFPLCQKWREHQSLEENGYHLQYVPTGSLVHCRLQHAYVRTCKRALSLTFLYFFLLSAIQYYSFLVVVLLRGFLVEEEGREKSLFFVPSSRVRNAINPLFGISFF